MKAALLLAVALLVMDAGATSDPLQGHLRVQRALHVPGGSQGQTCAVLDAAVFAHAASASLNDLRLFADGQETPFALTESNTDNVDSEPAAVRNLHAEGKGLTFDLEMPRRAYTAVELELTAKDFMGSAKVSARDGEGRVAALGTFAVFDLSGQGLPRSTTLALQESSFPELHVELQLHGTAGGAARQFGPEIVTGATVPPSRMAQTLYTTVAVGGAWSVRGGESVATLRLAPHVPVERVQVGVDPLYKRDFLREVSVAARPDVREEPGSAGADVDTVAGEISQVHIPAERAGAAGAAEETALDERQMDVDAVLAANLRGGATVEVAVKNGTEPPLPLRSVALQMRQRKICFNAASGVARYTMMYGDPQLAAPVYGYERSFAASATPVQATLGPEEANPLFAERADRRTFRERHPDLLWLGVLAGMSALGGVVLRGMRHQRGVSH